MAKRIAQGHLKAKQGISHGQALEMHEDFFSGRLKATHLVWFLMQVYQCEYKHK